FEQLLFAGHITTVTFRGDVLAQRLDGGTGNDLPTQRGLNRDVEHLPGDELFHALGQLGAPASRLITVHDGGQGVDPVAVDQDVEPNQWRSHKPLEVIVERGKPSAHRLDAIE